MTRSDGTALTSLVDSVDATPSVSCPDGSGRPRPASAAVRPVDSQWLLQGQKTVDIVHNGSVYRLQATKLGKLILTK